MEGRHQKSKNSILGMLNLKWLEAFKLSDKWLTFSSRGSEKQLWPKVIENHHH